MDIIVKEDKLEELGYMTCLDDLSNTVNNKISYVIAISTSIQEYLDVIK
jgi:hypothetical protein